jgi:hypothetical protein
VSNYSPITPPPELVEQWVTETWHEGTTVLVAASDAHIATQAAQWGPDQELEACVKWVSEYCPYFGDYPLPEDKLRTARRPKSPSGKEQALEAIGRLCASVIHDDLKNDAAIVRAALEQLPDAL